MGLRNGLYKAARALGDAGAVAKGRVGRRAGRRLVGKAVGRGLGKSGCFVATAVYGDAECRQVRALRRFRDRVLMRSAWGRAFVTLYYGGGGRMAARVVGRRPRLRRAVRRALDALLRRSR